MKYENKYEEYLKDESKYIGCAKNISFPTNLSEIQEIIDNSRNIGITIQGSKTGICGGATPNSDHLVVLKNLKKTLDFFKKNEEYYIKVECGVTLAELNDMLLKKNIDQTYLNEKAKKHAEQFKKAKPYFFGINPTETTASIGGIIATNASGIYSHHFKDLSYFLEELTVIDAQNKVSIIKEDLQTYIGSEGNFGIILDATLKLLMQKEHQWGLAFFFTKDKYVAFVKKCLGLKNTEATKIMALEYLDKNSLELFENYKEINSKLQVIPKIDLKYNHMLYIEIHSDLEEELAEIATLLLDFQENDDTWALIGNDEIQKFYHLRHAIPEAINIKIEQNKKEVPFLHKLSTDIESSNVDFQENLNETLLLFKGLDIICFGHVLNSHLHFNIIPKTFEEFEEAKIKLGQLYKKNKNSILFKEHGVGKIKSEFYLKYGNNKEHYLYLKEKLDPNNLFNKGNILK